MLVVVVRSTTRKFRIDLDFPKFASIGMQNSGRFSRTTTRRTPREDLLFASILFANPLAIWEEPTRGARHGGEIGVRPRGGSFQSLSGCISPSPQAVSQGHEITGFGWIHARWRTYVRSIGRSVAVATNGKYFADRDDRNLATHRYTYASRSTFPCRYFVLVRY